MDPHVIILEAKRDQEFLKQQRKDPVLKVPLKPGDRVVVCAHCRSVFLEETWEALKGRFEHGYETLSELPVDTLVFSRATSSQERATVQFAETAQTMTAAAQRPATENPNPLRRPAAQPYAPANLAGQPTNRVHQRSNENAERPTDTQERPAPETRHPTETPQPLSWLANHAGQVVNRARPLFNEVRQRSNGLRQRSTWNRAPQPRNDVRQRDSGSLTLREIPFELREIPFKLREIKAY